MYLSTLISVHLSIHLSIYEQSLTDLSEGGPVDAVEATCAEGEADGGADDGVGAGDRELEEGGHEVPDGAATCRRRVGGKGRAG